MNIASRVSAEYDTVSMSEKLYGSTAVTELASFHPISFFPFDNYLWALSHGWVVNRRQALSGLMTKIPGVPGDTALIKNQSNISMKYSIPKVNL